MRVRVKVWQVRGGSEGMGEGTGEGTGERLEGERT